MTERPIIFSAPMVRAILDGRKTMTRRVLKPQPEMNCAGLWVFPPKWTKPALVKWGRLMQTDEDGLRLMFQSDRMRAALPYAVGDRLWVREACFAESSPDGEGVTYPADRSWRMIDHTKEATEKWLDLLYYRRREDDGFEGSTGKLVPPIHMPRWASRITLTVTAVTVECLQSISEEDAKAEGMERLRSGRGYYCPNHGKAAGRFGVCHDTAKRAFADLWQSLHGLGSWEADPWVVAVSFERVTA